MRALEPLKTGYAVNPRDGVRVYYEVFGPPDARRTIAFLPSWSLVQSRVWKAQVPYFARHGFRVITADGRGNGRSDRPLTGYTTDDFTNDALTVFDALEVQQVALVAVSAGVRWALQLAAEHADRITHLVLVASSVMLSGAPRANLQEFHAPPTDTMGANKFNAVHWRQNFADFAEWFCHRIASEPHSTKQFEDLIEWTRGTTPETLIATIDESATPRAAEFAARVRCPALIVHGTDDVVMPMANSEALHAAIRQSTLVPLEGCGHAPQARDPVRFNILLHEFLGSARCVDRKWRRARSRTTRRALFVCSPIGLGHVQRDIAIADALHRFVPNLEIDWLAQEPVKTVLEGHGERIHPMSAELSSEAAHLESECGEHDLHVFQSWRRMDEILLANFLVFFDAVKDAQYDLWIGDEAWDIDYYLHENPELKTAPYVWMTDFVGWLPMRQDEEWLTADYNSEMIEQIARYPRVRDRALFIGNPADVVPDAFGPGLPLIRSWAEAHYAFPGYVQYFDARRCVDQSASLRDDLGFARGERVVFAAVGGTAVGRALLERILASFPEAKRKVPELRLIVVAGPRIQPESLPQVEGVEVRGYVPNLYEHFAACDLALVQGGLSTTMELVATGRPFLYFPLRNHFEQTFHVPHRLANYGVGTEARMDFAACTPDRLAEQMLKGLCSAPEYRPIEAGGAERAARVIAELL
jgi:pimeloyl-ACP methyl ester carboxylesterase/predicted glycosyltransferase